MVITQPTVSKQYYFEILEHDDSSFWSSDSDDDTYIGDDSDPNNDSVWSRYDRETTPALLEELRVLRESTPMREITPLREVTPLRDTGMGICSS